MEDAVNIECECGSDHYITIQGIITYRVERLDAHVMATPDDTNDEALITICTECHKIINMGVAEFDDNHNIKKITQVV